ncbi:MAG: Hsp33 family molecular chaperone HslO [Sporolactobacillus sp.]
MSDYYLKALACGGQLRVLTTVTTETVAEAQRRHGTWATASAALGRTLTATMMMAAQLKGDERLSVTIQGGGPIGIIVADADTQGHVRGYVTNSHTDAELNADGKLDVAGVVGRSGYLSVVKDLGMKNYFTGRVPLISGELGEDFTYYYARSEQIPSSVAVGVLVNPDQSIKAAGGFLVQVLPGAEEATITALEERLRSIPSISRLIEAGKTPEQLLEVLFPDHDYQQLESRHVGFKCSCSKSRFAQSLASLGTREIRTMMAEDHGAETVCHFCGSQYLFSEQELAALLDH